MKFMVILFWIYPRTTNYTLISGWYAHDPKRDITFFFSLDTTVEADITIRNLYIMRHEDDANILASNLREPNIQSFHN